VRLMEQWIRDRARPIGLRLRARTARSRHTSIMISERFFGTADLSVPDGRWAARVGSQEIVMQNSSGSRGGLDVGIL